MKKLVKVVAVLGLAAAMALPLAACGEAGKSAYDIAVEHGFIGTEEEWLESLRGPQGEQGEKGDQGEKGEQGEAGTPGTTPSITINEDGYWVINGEVTDVKAEGEDGKDGASGPMGPTGPAGVGIDSIATEIVDDGSGNFTTVITIILTDDTKYSFNLPGAAVSSGQEYEAGSSELFAELVKGGATSITLTDDVEVGEVLKISQDLTLDLNGKTLTVGSGIADGSAALRVEAGGKLTIDGNGTIDATKASDGVVPVAAMGKDALVTVEGGTIKVDTPKESCLYAMYGGEVVVNGGTFENSCTDPYEYGGGPGLTVNVSNSYKVSDIVVNGGTFIGRDPALGDDNLGGTFVAEGYVSVPGENNTYTIVESDKVARETYPVIAGTGAFKTLSDAVKAFNVAEKAPLANGALVVDLAAGTDYSLGGLSVVRGNVTLKGAGADSTTLTLTAAKSGQAGLEVAADGLTVKDMTIVLGTDVGDGNTAVIKPVWGDKQVEGLKLIGLTVIGNDKGHGINLHNVKDAVVENVTIDGYAKNGIAIASATGVKISSVQFNDTTAWADIGLMYADSSGKTIGTTAGEWYRTPVTGVKIGEGNTFGKGVVYSDITPVFAKTVTDYSGVTAEDMYDVTGMEAYGYVPVIVEKEEGEVQLQYLSEKAAESVEVVASVNGVSYQTLEKALAEAEDGATITLNADVTMTQAITFSKNVTLDLGGKKLTWNKHQVEGDANGSVYSYSVSSGATLRITGEKGSKLVFTESVESKNAADLVVSGTGSAVVIQGVDVQLCGGLLLYGDGQTDTDPASLSVEDATLESQSYCISTNASTENNVQKWKNVSITVTNSVLKAPTPIMLNVDGHLVVDGCTIEGGIQGIFLRAGEANISNSTISTSFEATNEDGHPYHEKWASGNCATAGAIVIGNKNGAGYYADAVCTLSGVINVSAASGSYGTYVVYVTGNDDVYTGVNDDKAFTTSIDYTGVTGGTFSGDDITVEPNGENAEIFINGEEYSATAEEPAGTEGNPADEPQA